MKSQKANSEYSLQTRLLLAVSIFLFVFLGLTGVVLDRAFINSIEAGAAERLQVQVYLLLSAVEEEEAGGFYFLQDFQEPRFGQLNSGLYGFISSSSSGELWRSDSANALTLSDPDVLRQDIDVGQSIFSKVTTTDLEELFVVNYGILWVNGISEFTFTVMESSVAYSSEISNFRASLLSWLGGVAVLMVLILVTLMRWSLAPLHRMARDLKMIESGEKRQLDLAYPKELRGVTDNLNLLIKSERKQQDRYRTTLGDLAHSLKTPLAVISGIMHKISSEQSSTNNNAAAQQILAVNEQLARMNQIVSYQLQRAVQSKSSSTLARQVNVAQTIVQIIKALGKVYKQKSMECERFIDAEAIFFGDERDLMEVMGNVLDNAFKYGRSKVLVTVNYEPQTKQLNIMVEDDGAGVAEDKRDFILQRGARIDTLAQGQGIGLAVVTDIVGSYDGQIEILQSSLGGARVSINF